VSLLKLRSNETAQFSVGGFFHIFFHNSNTRFAVSTRWEREVAEGKVNRDIHYYMCCCAKRVGNMFFLCYTRDGSPIFVVGPCWPFCVGVTLPLILVISALVCYFIVLNPDSGLVRMDCECSFSGSSQGNFESDLSFVFAAFLGRVYLFSHSRLHLNSSLWGELQRPWSY